MDNDKRVKGWWFAESKRNGKVYLPHGDGRLVEVGKTISVSGPIALCSNGLHASERLLDALKYAQGLTLSRVELHGMMQRDSSKLAAQHRTTLWRKHVGVDLAVFATAIMKVTVEDELQTHPLRLVFEEALSYRMKWLEKLGPSQFWKRDYRTRSKLYKKCSLLMGQHRIAFGSFDWRILNTILSPDPKYASQRALTRYDQFRDELNKIAEKLVIEGQEDVA